jgi:hypothetical protein
MESRPTWEFELLVPDKRFRVDKESATAPRTTYSTYSDSNLFSQEMKERYNSLVIFATLQLNFNFSGHKEGQSAREFRRPYPRTAYPTSRFSTSKKDAERPRTSLTIHNFSMKSFCIDYLQREVQIGLRKLQYELLTRRL